MLTQMRMLLDEDSDSGFLDTFLSYQFLNEAATDFVNRTKYLKTTQDITTVADQAQYDLNGNFMELYIKDQSERYVIKYNDGSATTMIPQEDYEDVFIAQSDSGTPGKFSIISDASQRSQLTGAATVDGDASGGQCTLTDTDTSQFASVEAGDSIHNTTDGSNGVVLSVTSTSAIVVALFGGTDNEWDQDDAYVLQPQNNYQLVLDPAPDTASETVTVPYIRRPAPVYSDYGMFNIPSQFHPAIVKYAAWLYKYVDREQGFGDKWYVLYDQQAKLFSSQIRKNYKRPRLSVNLRARRR